MGGLGGVGGVGGVADFQVWSPVVWGRASASSKSMVETIPKPPSLHSN